MSNKPNAEPTKAHVRPIESVDLSGVMTSLGEIVTLMARSRKYRHAFLAELDWLLAPALASRQFSVAKSSENGSTTSVPVAAIIWACVSPEVDARLESTGERPRLRPNEWRSGDIAWLIDTIGDPRAAAILLKRLVDVRFPVTGIKTLVRNNGKYEVEIVRGGAAGDTEKACA